jgi:hypothetical protein
MQDMAKTIYVRGNILVKTEDYKYNIDDGALYTIPEGAEIINPTKVVEGSPCLVIENDFRYSIFNIYRATGSLASIGTTSYYYNSDANEVYQNYKKQRIELDNMLDSIEHVQIENKEFLYKLMMGNAITILESFVRDIILAKITSSEENFISYYSLFYNNLSNQDRDEFNRMDQGSLERRVIKRTYDDTYSNAKKVNRMMKLLFNTHDCVCSGTNIGNYIQERHDIFHKNARMKNGSYKIYEYTDVKKAINEDEKVINKIMSLV